MREVQSTEQLRDILVAARNIVLIRDAIYGKLYEINNAGALQNAARFTKNSLKLWLISLAAFPFFIAAIAVPPKDKAIPIFMFIAIIVAAIVAQVASNKSHARKIEEYINGIETDKTRMRHEVSQLEAQVRTYTDTFWCAEIVPPEYRNQRALEIMINAINASRADNWKECTDIYDRACMNAEMRNYQEQQIRISQEVAYNANAAANAAGVAATASVLNLLFR
jgi:hypothetical protein